MLVYVIKLCLTCYRSVDCHIRRYDIRVGKMTADYTGHPVTSVTLSKDGQCILASSLDNTVRLLDKETGELLNEYASYLVVLSCTIPCRNISIGRLFERRIALSTG